MRHRRSPKGGDNRVNPARVRDRTRANPCAELGVARLVPRLRRCQPGTRLAIRRLASSLRSTAPRRPIPPVDLIQSRRQRGADEQVVVTATSRHTPLQQLPRSRQDLISTGCQLVTVDAGDIGSVVAVLLDPPIVISSRTDLPARVKGRLLRPCASGRGNRYSEKPGGRSQ